MKTLSIVAVFAALALVFAVPRLSYADDITNVSINTSSLAGQSGSELVFEFTDGSGLGDANNTATLSGFDLGGGTAGAVDTVNSFGGYSGDLSSGVTLTDNSFLAVFGQFLDPGSSLSFNLDLTTNVDAGGTPDQFSMYLYDPSGNPLTTTSDPTGFDSLLTINLDSSNPATDNYDSALVTTSAPVTKTPEPSTILLLGLGLLALAAVSSREKIRLALRPAHARTAIAKA